MLGDDGGLKLLDFGLALLLEPHAAQERLTEVGALLGTPSYMAPEQLTGDPVDSRCDIFALGVVLYELASGSNPFSGKTPMASIAKILSADPESNPGLQEQAPELDRIIRRCLQKDPQERYQSAEELATNLGRVRAGQGRLIDGEVQVDPGEGSIQASDPPLRSFWWAVHQVIVMLVYSWMVYTLWKVKEGIPTSWSLMLFFGVLGCAVANGTLRTHLLFTSRFNRSAMRAEAAASVGLDASNRCAFCTTPAGRLCRSFRSRSHDGRRPGRRCGGVCGGCPGRRARYRSCDLRRRWRFPAGFHGQL